MNRFIFIGILIFPAWLFAQQIPDTAWHPAIPNPEFKPGKGPVVFIDEGHHNFHTKEGRYKPFSNLLERDGYVVKEYTGDFSKKELSVGKILVIANALNEKNVEDWYLPTPSAFTKAEMAAVKDWVHDGGNLLLIADHMPMAGAAKDLAAEFGFEFTNGFVIDTVSGGTATFSLREKTLVESKVTKGRDSAESVDQIVSFTGQGFNIPPDATPVMIFTKNFVNMLPDTAWVFTEKTPVFNAGGLSQGAYKNFGKGKVAVFGEAAMFTAQLAGPEQRRIGMNSDMATQNYQLVLNVIHWLEGKLE
jgi:hypothetical protein